MTRSSIVGKDLTPVREAMRIAYGEDVYEEGITGMDEDQLIEAAGNVARGVQLRHLFLTVRAKRTLMTHWCAQDLINQVSQFYLTVVQANNSVDQ